MEQRKRDFLLREVELLENMIALSLKPISVGTESKGYLLDSQSLKQVTAQLNVLRGDIENGLEDIFNNGKTNEKEHR